MDKELQDKLYEKYPKIFRQKDLSAKETAMCWGISCGNGWFNIIDVLCENLQQVVDYPHEEIELYQSLLEKEKQADNSEEKIEWFEQKIEFFKKRIVPQLEAVQVKEKYGSLRFYLSGYPVQPEIDEKVSAIINFAEAISRVTCEDCGQPGKQRGRGWLYTSCDSCEEDRFKDKAERIKEARQLKLNFDEK